VKRARWKYLTVLVLVTLMLAVGVTATANAGAPTPKDKVAVSQEQATSLDVGPLMLSSYGTLLGTYPMFSAAGSQYHGARTGTLEVYWNGSTKRNTVIARAYGPTVGVPMYRLAKIRLMMPDGPWIVDAGTYSYYAGPVSVYAPGRCIGGVGSFGSGGFYGYAGFGPGFCG